MNKSDIIKAAESLGLIALAFVLPHALISFLIWDLQWYLPNKEGMDASWLLRFMYFFIASFGLLGALYLIIEEIYKK